MKLKKILSTTLAGILLLSMFASLVWAALPAGLPLQLQADDPPECDATYSAEPLSVAPVINGTMEPTEWGDPIIVTSPEHAVTTWGPNGYQNPYADPIDQEQRVTVYLSNDSDYVYLAVTMDHAEEGVAQSSLTRGPGLFISISQWDENNTVLHKTVGEKDCEWFSGFKMGWTTIATQSASEFPNADSLSAKFTASDWKGVYNTDTDTYTYEVRIPLSATNIDLTKSEKIALSIRINDGNPYPLDQSKDPKCYNIGGTGAKNMDWAKPGWTPSTGTPYPNREQAKEFTLIKPDYFDEGTYDNDTVAEKKDDITIDANLSPDEWDLDNPMIVTSPGHAMKWSYGYDNPQKDPVNREQRVKVYATNDNDYIYLAVTMDHAVESVAQSSLTRGPGLFISISQWDATNNVLHKTVGEKDCEWFSGFKMGWTTIATQSASEFPNADSLGANFTASDWEGVYNADTDTYTYEVRIPFSATNIDLLQSEKIALSIRINDGNPYPADQRKDPKCYNIGGTGAKNMDWAKPEWTPSTGTPYPNREQAMEVNLKPFKQIDPDTYAKDTVEIKRDEIILDANVSQDEWGEPIIITSPYHAVNTWGTKGFTKTQSDNSPDEQRVKVYATNDKDYIYLAVTMDHSAESVPHASFYRAPHICIAISQWDETNTVPVIDNSAQYSAFRVGFINGGLTDREYAYGLDSTKVQITEADYMAAYKDGAYTYEVRIPLTATNIDLTKSQDIALSILVGDSNTSTGTTITAANTNNRYNIGGTAAANMEEAHKPGNFTMFKDQAMKLTLQQQYYVKDRVPYISESVAIDGKITAKEWGYPVLVTNPEHTQNTWGSFVTNEPSAVNQEQLACLWLTNDKDYVYVGATLDHSNYQGSVDKQATERAHFLFDISTYNEQTTVPLVDGKEQLAGFVMWLDNDGNPMVECRTTGMEAWTPSADDYKIVYNEATKTYTYEMRIPYNKTNIDLGMNLNMAFSGSIGTTYTGEGTSANVYHLQTGHIATGDTPHQGKMIPFTLNRTAIVKDTVSPFLGNIAIDGKVTTEEWGSPVILTFPDDAKANWLFWEKDGKATNPDQTVKIFITNDAENLYVACTIDHAQLDMEPGSGYNKPHFYFSVGRWNEETGMEHIISMKKEYERFSLYNLNKHNFGYDYLNAKGYSLAQVSSKDCDYIMNYDPETETYTFELRIPLSKTTLRFGNQNEVAMSFTASPGRVYNTIPNRYVIGGTGAANGHLAADEGSYPHAEGQCMKFKLNPNNYTTKPEVKYQASANGTVNPNTADQPILVMVSLLVVAGITLVIFSALRRKYNK